MLRAKSDQKGGKRDDRLVRWDHTAPAGYPKRGAGIVAPRLPGLIGLRSASAAMLFIGPWPSKPLCCPAPRRGFA
jgi:hypothetical protein